MVHLDHIVAKRESYTWVMEKMLMENMYSIYVKLQVALDNICQRVVNLVCVEGRT